MDITVYCDFNPGTGLGGSSSLVVALVTALSEVFNFKFTNKQLIKFCYDIERNMLGIQGGWQDQIAAVHGGLCVTYFENGDFGTHKIDISQNYTDFLNSALFLLPIGNKRESSKIHEQQKLASKKINYHKKMQDIVQLANQCAEMIGQENLEGFGDILHNGWLLKRGLGDFISSKEIDETYDKLCNFGAHGGRLLGAGKSGYLLCYVRPEMQSQFLSKCIENNIRIERVNIDTKGARIGIDEW